VLLGDLVVPCSPEISHPSILVTQIQLADPHVEEEFRAVETEGEAELLIIAVMANPSI
jgi:hypothetical protein